MPKTFNFHDSENMCYAVTGSYVTKNEVLEYFRNKFPEDREFTGDELKAIVKDLIDGKERRTGTMKQIDAVRPIVPIRKPNNDREK